MCVHTSAKCHGPLSHMTVSALLVLMFGLTFACFFHIPTLNIFPNASTYLSHSYQSQFLWGHLYHFLFSFIRALHPLPPLLTLSYEFHPKTTVQELPFTVLLGWPRVVPFLGIYACFLGSIWLILFCPQTCLIVWKCSRILGWKWFSLRILKALLYSLVSMEA